MSSIDDGASRWNGEDGVQKEVGGDSHRHCRGMNDGDLMMELANYQSQCTCRRRRHQRQ